MTAYTSHNFTGVAGGKCTECGLAAESLYHYYKPNSVNLKDEEACIREKVYETNQKIEREAKTMALLDAFAKNQGFITKDSGERKQFASGMVRDVTTGKTAWHAVMDGPMLGRWAGLLTRGKEKYPDVAPGVPNWTLANGPEEMARYRESVFRHFIQWFRGDTDEDHAAAVFFNVNGIEALKEKLNDKS